ncbi:glucosaminidase domain-containing protein [Maribacter polysaccharolyticus]|uniref:glucosaminidase domain-containing protein n=1 Tax=Maribacter polysaccharolyticus TaxID=3020831 RepID=UPI00237F7360|nr:glucosaminidase domain-containing protein [Maribacter polysaccharolyticus]MDE3742745.1 glucosaminidase domain-containing protein [Maribacter polysaccharolyticus]
MMKKLISIAVLGIFLIGCKASKRTTHTDRSVQREAKTTNENTRHTYASTGRYPLPEDDGKFKRFSIGSAEEYIDTFSEISQYEMKAYGIPASITLAQGLLESGYGKGELAVKTNNHFGIKCHKGWQGDYDYHDDDEKGECFRKYNHPMYSYRDHSEFLTSRARYAFLFNYGSTDYERWAKGLREAGYATDRKYPQKLIYLIEKYKLYRFDKGVRLDNAIVAAEPKVMANKVHVVKKGDTLYSISRRYFISVDEIKRINNMNSNNLAIGQKITIQTK